MSGRPPLPEGTSPQRCHPRPVFRHGRRRRSNACVLRRDINQVLETDRLRQLIGLGPALVAELDLDVLLN